MVINVEEFYVITKGQNGQVFSGGAGAMQETTQGEVSISRDGVTLGLKAWSCDLIISEDESMFAVKTRTVTQLSNTLVIGGSSGEKPGGTSSPRRQRNRFESPAH